MIAHLIAALIGTFITTCFVLGAFLAVHGHLHPTVGLGLVI